ncbi:DUF2793 domain-containing protein [Rhizobium sp. L1K21]|uniref:DUF2793 domain-containing protein n=1 Tax=Rhizobium sp. L1K21 TaxID=2954933 RepID=UPI00209317F4|nr:DUF2793 domain-containing protein [Rhizobium sp. L1K21]MCO6185308.1 DUF2793 domain-containing protein [Rhizobium sp. L1K21]
MTDNTPNLALPYILASQAQKHITHNEALRQLDGLIALTISNTLPSPPASPAEGETFLIAPSADGDWAGKDGQIANFVDSTWQYFTPKAGWTAWFKTNNQILVFDGTAWVNPLSTGNLDMLGINAAPDETNRLSLSAAASLFNNAGNGHQIKVNKASAGDTASLLFQTAWSGRAEMGTAGSDDFTFKMSPDGASWKTALQISGSGIVTMPQRPMAKADKTGAAFTPADGSQSGFDTLSLSQGGMTLGAALASGNGSKLVIPAAGTYLLSLNAKIHPTAAFAMQLVAKGSTVLTSVSSDMSESGYRTFSATTMATLSAGDTLTFLHSGSAEIAGGTSLTALLV